MTATQARFRNRLPRPPTPAPGAAFTSTARKPTKTPKARKSPFGSFT